MAAHLSGEATAIATVLTAVGAAFEYLRRMISRSLNAWRKGDEILARRIDDTVAGNIREIDTFRNEFSSRLDRHEAKDDERFLRLDGRLEEIRNDMARRDDQKSINDKIDQLLLRGNGK